MVLEVYQREAIDESNEDIQSESGNVWKVNHHEIGEKEIA